VEENKEKWTRKEVHLYHHFVKCFTRSTTLQVLAWNFNFRRLMKQRKIWQKLVGLGWSSWASALKFPSQKNPTDLGKDCLFWVSLTIKWSAFSLLWIQRLCLYQSATSPHRLMGRPSTKVINYTKIHSRQTQTPYHTVFEVKVSVSVVVVHNMGVFWCSKCNAYNLWLLSKFY